MRSAKKIQFGVHLAADYGPKRSNSSRLAGGCLTIFAAKKGFHRVPAVALNILDERNRLKTATSDARDGQRWSITMQHRRTPVDFRR
jgi:hypothetical protein